MQAVEALLNYLVRTSERPQVYVYAPPPGTAQRTTRSATHAVRVLDARDESEKLSLDEQGVSLAYHESDVDFYDAEQVRSVYFPQVETLVGSATGAAEVLVFDHNVRCRPMAERRENGAQMPVRFVHNDYTERSGPQRVRDLLEPDEAEERLRRRFAVVNVWRPIRGPVQETPLAVCDARTIAPDDLVPTDLKYRDRTGEVYSVAYNPEHRWLYFPAMQREEVMLIKCYDSERDGRARFTAHTAFDDPTSPPDAPARESIEVRTLAFFRTGA